MVNETEEVLMRTDTEVRNVYNRIELSEEAHAPVPVGQKFGVLRIKTEQGFLKDYVYLPDYAIQNSQAEIDFSRLGKKLGHVYIFTHFLGLAAAFAFVVGTVIIGLGKIAGYIILNPLPF
jgi:hypothetical protein